MKHFLFVTLFLGGILPLFTAQTTADEIMVKELTDLRNRYQKLSAFSVDINYRLYVGNSAQAEESYTASLIRKGKQHRLTSKEQVSIVNNHHTMTVNHTEKMVLFQQGVSTESEIDPSAIDVATLLKLSHKTTKLKELTDGLKGYRFEFYNAQYNSIDVIYTSTNYTIKKIILEAHVSTEEKQQRLEIGYSNMDATPSITSTTFNTKKYITIKDQKASLTAPYQSYKLIN